MILYGHDTSPYVRRIRVLLAELGIPFTRDANSWTVADAEVLRINPMLRVPALVDSERDGQVLLDSKLIANYLYERYATASGAAGDTAAGEAGALPFQRTLFDPEQRWDDENTLLAIDAATDSTINVFLLELDGIPAEGSSYLRRQQQRVRSCLHYVEERLGEGETFRPGRFGFLDVALTCTLDWMRFRGRYAIETHPGFVRFLERHRDRPSLAATHPIKAQSAALPKTPR